MTDLRMLEAKIAKVKAALAALGDLRPGTLSQQYNVCGNPGFVRREDVPAVRTQLRNYQRLRTLVDTWISAGLELSRLRRDQARARRAKTREALAHSRKNGV